MVKPGSQGKGLQACSSSTAYFGQASLHKKKKAKSAATGVHKCLHVRKNCSRNKVVEPVGKTTLALDTVFGHKPEKE